IDRQVKPWRPTLNSTQDKMFDGVEAYCSKLHGLLHRRMHVGEIETFQQAQYLHIFPFPMLCHAAFHQPTQRSELFGQSPSLKRSRLIQRIDLLLDQWQVMQRIKDYIFPTPIAHMARDDLTAA